ncbi:MAG: ATP-binding cassette domain-containing protein [Alphaproteobacteria bacterium]|nr:MAG: ATP-binding cassette domain-containing protein [Alphaproteobacteria bacterium]
MAATSGQDGNGAMRVTFTPASRMSDLPGGPLLIEVEEGRLLLFFRDARGVRHFLGEAAAGGTLLLPTAGDGNEEGDWLLGAVPQARLRLRSLSPDAPIEEGSEAADALAVLVRTANVEASDDAGATLGDRLVALNRQLSRRAEAEEAATPARFAAFEEERKGLLQRAIRKLVSVAGSPVSVLIDSGPSCEDPALAALVLAMRLEETPLSLDEIARLEDVLTEASDDAAVGEGASAEDPLERTMRLADVRYRRVDLEDGWWRTDHGILLVRTGDVQYLVLEPVGGRKGARYRCWHPGEGLVRDLDPETARELGNRAFQPCARLPAWPLGLGDLLRQGFWRFRGDAWRIAALLIAAAVLSLGTPLATGVIMSQAIPEGDNGLLLVLFLALVAAALAGSLFDLVRSLLMVRIEGRAAWRLQTTLWDRLLRLPVSFFRNFDVGDLANRALSIDTIRAMVGAQAVEVVSQLFFGLFALVLMFWYSPLLAAVAGGAGLVFALISGRVGRRVGGHVKRITDDTGRLESMVFQFIQAIAKIRIAGATVAAFARFADLYRGILGESRRQQMAQALLSAFSGVWPVIVFAALVLTTALAGGELLAAFRNPINWAEIEGTSLRAIIAPAGFIAFYTALGQFSIALVGAGRAVVFLASVRPWAERITPLLEATPEMGGVGGGRRLGDFSGHLRVVGLAFRYRGEAPRVLDGIDFEVRPGEMIALVGPSGAGKSTVVRLLLGFERPEAGSIFYDGVDLTRLDPAWLRRRIGVVLQDGRLLPGSIFENIAAGSRISRERVMEAIRMAGMEADLEEMPMGLETMLGEGAVTLSGGQRQRLMIARALVRRTKLLIFDEATSALDNETQAVVSESLARLKASRLVIAHRLSTIRDAERIHVLEGGRIVQSGRFEELLAVEGAFRRLARRQMIAPPAPK